MSVMIQLLIIAILTAINAFFAGAEMAMVSMDKDKIEALASSGNKDAKRLLEISKNPNKFLSTIQVGITLAGFFSSASAATGLSVGFGQWLEAINVPFANQLSVILITIILSYFILVFGELFPKRLALCHAEKVALRSVKPIDIIGKVTAPFVKILTLSINGLMKLFKIKMSTEEDPITEEKIRVLLRKGASAGAIKPIEAHRIHRIFEFDDKMASEIMIPIDEVYMIDVETPIKDLIDNVTKEKKSRIPVFKGSRNQVLGVLLIKDLYEGIHEQGIDHVNIEKLLHKPIFIDQTIKIDALFLKLQKLHKHLVFVKNDLDKLSGIITLEDMIEEVFGEIEDEFDV